MEQLQDQELAKTDSHERSKISIGIIVLVLVPTVIIVAIVNRQVFLSIIILPIIFVFFAFIYTIGATKIVNQGNEALVERLGRYNRTLKPGYNLIIPFIDKIVVEDTLREQSLYFEPLILLT